MSFIKRILSMALVLVLLSGILPVQAWAVTAVSGDFMQKVNQITWEDMIPEGYTTISTEQELEAIQNDPDGLYILMEDIKIESFDILCSNDDPFTGVMEGNGHTISGIEIDLAGNKGSTYYWGLFSTVEDARIANLKVSGSLKMTVYDYSKYGRCYIGGLVGLAQGDVKIVNCVNAVSIYYGTEQGFKYMGVGGILGGYAGSTGDSATISSCKNMADVFGVYATGGIIGHCETDSSEIRITNCRNVARVDAYHAELGAGYGTGGIIGYLHTKYASNAEIYACMNSGKIDGRIYSGGIIGEHASTSAGSEQSPYTTISSCANVGEVGANEQSGGIMSFAGEHCFISDCINTATVGVAASQTNCGGIIGLSYESVVRCINTGKVIAGSFNSAIICTVFCETNEQAKEMIQDCYWLGGGETNTLYRSCFWDSTALIVTDGMMTAEEMKDPEKFRNYDFPAVWTMDEERGHPFPTALLDVTLDNLYQEAYISDTISFSEEGYQFLPIFEGSGDGSLAGVLGDTYSATLSDEINGIWESMQFAEDIANYSIPSKTDYDVLLADLLAGSTSRNIRDKHLTSKTMNFFSELITVSGAGLDAANVLQTEKYLSDMADIGTVFGDPAKKVMNAMKSTALKDIPFDEFSGAVSKLGGVVNIAQAGAAGCETVLDAFDFMLLCNAYSQTVEGYSDVIVNAAWKAAAIDAEEGGDLLASAETFSQKIRDNMNQDPKALYEATGGAIDALTVTGGCTILEGVLKLKELNPVLSVLDGIKTGITVGMPVADGLTNMDDIAYYGRMMELSNTLAKGLHAYILDCRDAFAHSQEMEDAQKLNLASDFYLNLQILACEYAFGYNNAIMSSSLSGGKVSSEDIKACEQLQGYKEKLLRLQKSEKNVYIGGDGSISGFVANCPVTVIVTDSSGREISSMKTGSISVAEGYGGNYLLLGRDGEHKAGLYNPNEHTVTIVAEGSGTMDLVTYGSEDGKLTYINTYRQVPIEEGSSYVVTDTMLDGEEDVLPTDSEILDPEKHPHTYQETVTEPTCTQQGYTTYECVCGSSYVDNYVPATGVHVYSDAADESCNTCGYTRLILPMAPDGADVVPMYRLYNPNSGEHFYTGSPEETNILYNAGWHYEGVAWNAPVKHGEPVYRMYNPNSGDHHYTMSAEERGMLIGVGWQYEGVCWNSMGDIALYRLYNPNADCGSHHYTGSEEERDNLVSVGWLYEGIGWFGMLN